MLRLVTIALMALLGAGWLSVNLQVAAVGQDLCGNPPGAPSGLTITVAGRSVTAVWRAAEEGCSPSSYVIEAGTAPGLNDLPFVPIKGTATTLTLYNIDEGLYFVRVRAINADGNSEPSNEVRVSIGNSPCGGLPPQPSGVFATVTGTTVAIAWDPVGRSPNAFRIEIGSSSGRSNVVSRWTASAEPAMTVTLPRGTYYLRVRARNDCGIGQPSREIVVPAGGTPGVPDVFIVRRTADRNTYFPTIERLNNGHLVVVYYDSPDHVSPMGRISLVRSVDDGQTWSRPVVVVDSPLDDRDPSVMQTSRGALLLNYFSPASADGAQRGGVFVTRSDDEGETWSAPVRVETSMESSATSSRIVELANGELLIPIYGATPTRARSTVVRSIDDGRTWPKSGEVQIRTSRLIDLVEPALVHLGAGRLMAVMRAERPIGQAMQSRSTDGGRTWSAPKGIGSLAQASDLLALPRNAGGSPAVVHSWGDWSRRHGTGRTTLLQLIEPRRPPLEPVYGATRVVYNSRCDDASQPSTVAVGARLFTVFYDACAGYIGGTFSTIPSVRR